MHTKKGKRVVPWCFPTLGYIPLIANDIKQVFLRKASHDTLFTHQSTLNWLGVVT
jgi:hypothetical protein